MRTASIRKFGWDSAKELNLLHAKMFFPLLADHKELR